VHHTLLSAGMVLIENLTGLEKLPESGFYFSCLPLKIQSGDGSPVRAVAITTL
jgi:kynurenine formamidase